MDSRLDPGEGFSPSLGLIDRWLLAMVRYMQCWTSAHFSSKFWPSLRTSSAS